MRILLLTLLPLTTLANVPLEKDLLDQPSVVYYEDACWVTEDVRLDCLEHVRYRCGGDFVLPKGVTISADGSCRVQVWGKAWVWGDVK